MIVELGSKRNLKTSKAGNLNYLYNEVNVAKGFVLTNTFVKEFLNYNNIIEFKSHNITYIKDNLDNINKEILNGKLNNKLKKNIFSFFQKLKLDRVIIRSSTSIEDSKNYSFAGQFKSIQMVTKDNLLESIKKCVASLYQENVLSYLEKNNIAIDNISFEILIQEMIDGKLSGIAFSKNPINNKKEIVVEIANTSCNKIVDGSVIPKTYYIKDNEKHSKELDEIINLLNKLKEIYKYDIEIEFSFEKDKLYLFQVRPITKTYFSFVDYIENESWCNFKNNNRYLFDRTLWIKGAYQYKHYSIINEITEDIVIYDPNNLKQERVFNAFELPISDETLKYLSAFDLVCFIKEYKVIENEIKRISPKIEKFIELNDYDNFNKYLKVLVEKNSIINSYEYLIGSLSQRMYQNLSKEIIEKVSKWRNNPNNGYYKIYEDIFNYVINYFSLDIDKKLLKTYITCDELLNLCDKKLSRKTLLKRIETRKNKGFILLNLHNPKYNNKVIVNEDAYKRVKKVIKREQDSFLNNNQDGIKGKSTFKNGKIIKGEAIVIKDNQEKISDYNIKDKIVVMQVTTASDVKYLQDVKALIVDNGGILCHSAIFSREFNIPCLMGCEIATKYFNNNDVIIFDIDKEIAYKDN